MNERAGAAVQGSDPEKRRIGIAVMQAFYAAWRAAAVYSENNNAYRSRREEFAAALSGLFETGDDCSIVFQNDYFFFNGERLNYDREFGFGRSMASRFSELHLGGITIRSGIAPGQLDQALFALAQADRRLDDPFSALLETWKALGITDVAITPLVAHASGRLLREGASEAEMRALRRRRAHALFQRSEAVVQEFWERVRDRNSFDAASVQRIVHQLIDEVAHDEEILLEFATLRDFDEYTYYHSVNVAIYSIAVGMRLGLDRVRLAHLGLAALFHDIGKVKLPHDLITKPAEFNEDDWVQIKRHPVLGALTLASIRPIDPQVGTAMAGAYEHHMKGDLSGYPGSPGPRALHLFSRIISLCDAFDAMTSGRVYQKQAMHPDEAIQRLLYKGREWYDPLVLKAFIHVVGIFPVGTIVRLSDGTIGVVMRNDPDDVYSPEVLIIRDSQGLPVRRALRLRTRDDTPPAERLHVTEILDPRAVHVNIHDYIGVLYRPEETEATIRALELAET